MVPSISTRSTASRSWSHSGGQRHRRHVDFISKQRGSATEDTVRRAFGPPRSYRSSHPDDRSITDENPRPDDVQRRANLAALVRHGRNYKILRPPRLQNSQNPTVAMARMTPVTISGMPMLLNMSSPPTRRATARPWHLQRRAARYRRVVCRSDTLSETLTGGHKRNPADDPR